MYYFKKTKVIYAYIYIYKLYKVSTKNILYKKGYLKLIFKHMIFGQSIIFKYFHISERYIEKYSSIRKTILYRSIIHSVNSIFRL